MLETLEMKSSLPFASSERNVLLPSKNAIQGGLRTKGIIKSSSIEKPLISIVTAVFNGEKFLEQSIQSVCSQSYDNFEYIIIDGQSRDNTLDIIRKYDDAIDYWVSEPDRGIYDAWNKALSLTQGEWIMFLGADDFLIPDILNEYLDFIHLQPSDIQFISAKVELIDSNQKTIKIVGTPWKWNIFKRYMNIAHVGALHHIKLFEMYGTFDIHYKIAGDYDFLLRSQQKLIARYMNKVVARMTNDGVSNTQIAIALQETKTAKIHSGSRAQWLCEIDIIWSKIKYGLRVVSNNYINLFTRILFRSSRG